MEHNPYDLSDKAIRLLNKKAVKRFSDAQSRLVLEKFDELSIIHEMEKLYKALDADNRKTFLDLAGLVYMGVEPHGEKKPTKKWLNGILSEYSAVTKYRYDYEVDRKREYAQEAIIAARAKVPEFKRALRYWSRFTANYADIVTDEAVLKAFRDSGVKRVRWVTEDDDRVCDDCQERDGAVYDIEKVPPKPHLGCRCVLLPAIEK